jgi:hypothetical protein
MLQAHDTPHKARMVYGGFLYKSFHVFDYLVTDGADDGDPAISPDGLCLVRRAIQLHILRPTHPRHLAVRKSLEALIFKRDEFTEGFCVETNAIDDKV